MFGSWMGWALDGYDLVLMLFVLTSVSYLFFLSEDSKMSLLSSFAAYVIALLIRPVGGGLIIGAWAPMITIDLFLIDEQHILYLLAFNIIVETAAVLIGVRLNPETLDIDLVEHPHEPQK